MKKLILFSFLSIAIVAIAFTSCTKSKTSVDCSSLTNVKWATDSIAANNVQTIVNNKCTNCHNSGGQSPDLSSYANVKASSSSVNSAVNSGKMPPSGSSSLSADQSSRIQCWIAQGANNN